jgi:adenine-specific DNA-methyltransferase
MNQKIKDGYVKFRKDHTEPPIRKTYLLRTIEEEIEESIDEESQNDDIGIQVAGTYFYRSGLQATNELENLFGVKKLFNNPKDHEVLARLVKYCTSNDKEALVLDFFAGSGVIGQAIMEPNKEDGGNRKFILVQIPELTDEKSEAFKAGYKKISEITIERNKRVVERIIAKKEAEHPNLFEENKDALKGLGFKVFQLVKSNFPRTEFKPDAKKTDEENIEALKKYIEEKERQQTFDFNIEDLLTEILLKQGFMMNFKIAEQPEFTNNRVIHATDGEKETLICLDEDIKLETIEYLKTHNEQKFICLERALDTTKKWNLNHYLGEKFLAF